MKLDYYKQALLALIVSVFILALVNARLEQNIPKNQSTGLSDPETRARGGRRRAFFIGYKTHCSDDWNNEISVAYVVAPANENEKRHFKLVVSRPENVFRTLSGMRAQKLICSFG